MPVPNGILYFHFRWRAGAILPQTLQSAAEIPQAITLRTLRLYLNMDALAMDIITVAEAYQIEIAAGACRRFGARLIHLPWAGMFSPEAQPALLPPGSGLSFAGGETARCSLTLTATDRPRLTARKDGGQGLMVYLAGVTSQ